MTRLCLLLHKAHAPVSCLNLPTGMTFFLLCLPSWLILNVAVMQFLYIVTCNHIRRVPKAELGYNSLTVLLAIHKVDPCHFPPRQWAL